MAEYPIDLEGDVVLSDGGTAFLRPITPSDGARLVAFHSRLSREAIYYRFFSPHPRLSEKEVIHFTTVDYDDRMALILLLGDDIIAVARYDAEPGTDHAEVAFTVDDEHHRRGIATLLFEHLAAAARDRGIRRFTAITLPDNRGMSTVFREVGFASKSGFVDGVVEFTMELELSEAGLARIESRENRAQRRSVEPLLRPKSVAVVGASDTAGSVGHSVIANLVGCGYSGAIYPVNNRASVVAEMLTYTTVLDLPERPDLVVIAVPGSQVHAVIEQCAARGAKVLIVLTADVPDADDLGGFTRRLGMRLVGPESLGVIVTDPTVSLHASFTPVRPLAGTTALVGQSGPLLGAVVQQASRVGLGFNAVVSLGEKSDISANDLLQYWAEEAAVSSVLLYGESFGNAEKFLRIVRSMGRETPVVSVPAGSGFTAADEAMCRQIGLIAANDVEELLDIGRLLAAQPLPKGDRVLVISNSKSAGEMAAATAANIGLSVSGNLLVPLASNLEEYARMVSDHAGEFDSLIAIYAPAVSNDQRSIVQALAQSLGPDVCAVAVVLGDDPVKDAVNELANDPGNDSPSEPLEPLDESPNVVSADDRSVNRIPTYHFPNMAVRALGKVTEHALWTMKPDSALLEPDDGGSERFAEDSARPLQWAELSEVLTEANLAVANGQVAKSPEEAGRFAEQIGFPVAMKYADIPLRGRSERGGISLDLHDTDSVRAAFDRMTDAAPGEDVGLLIQAMTEPGVEVMVAVREHPLFGRVLEVGLGGLYADFLGERPSRTLPLSPEDARSLAEESMAGRAIEQQGFSPELLVDLVEKVAVLAMTYRELNELRLNPVIVGPAGAVTVGGRGRIRPVPNGLPIRRL